MPEARLNEAQKTLFIVDASAIMFRSFYGLAPLRSSKGFPTQAIIGFFKSIQKLCTKFAPHYLLLCWDSCNNKRRELYPAYKENRQKFPDDLAVQREKIVQIADAMGIAQLEISGFEADDLIFSAVQQFTDLQVVIVSSDKDLLQLVDARTRQYDPAKDLLYSTAQVQEFFGFGPEKIAFYHALLGDSSDNIPGADGIGKKTALELVTQFSGLEDLYAHLEQIKPRTATLLQQSKDAVLLSEQLFALQSVSLPINLDALKLEVLQWHRAKEIFIELEFTSLLNNIAKETQTKNGTAAVQTQTSGQQSLLTTQGNENLYEWLNFEVINDAQTLQKVLETAKQHTIFAFDLETSGLNHYQEHIVGMSFAFDAQTAFYVPLAHHNYAKPQLDLQKVLAALRPIFNDNKILKIIQNAKFDLHFLAAAGMDVDGINIFDTLLAARLVRPEWQKMDLPTLAQDYLQISLQDFQSLFSSFPNIAHAPISLSFPYAASHAHCTWKLHEPLRKALEEQGLLDVFANIEMPLCNIILAMENAGIKLDTATLTKLGVELQEQMRALELKIRASLESLNVSQAPTLNLLSPQQVEAVLFDELKLQPAFKNKGGMRSTSQDSLEELAKIHPVPNMILAYRKLAKLQNTYIDALPKQVNAKTGRIHTTFLQTRVATGRLSSVEPNLQNIPVSIRSAFVSMVGHLFLAADYSQIELRVLAHLTEDEKLCAAFAQDQDIHAQTAGDLFKCSVTQVTPEQRQIGKRINFSVIYGLSAFSLGRELNLSRTVAQEYIDAFFGRYSKVRPWMEQTLRFAQQNGYTQTLLGRRRHFPTINDRNQTVRTAAERAAVNSVIQGTAAEIIKLAMVKIQQFLQEKPDAGQILLQVHDELLFEVKTDKLEPLRTATIEIMQQAVVLRVPLKVSSKSGTNWGQVSK